MELEAVSANYFNAFVAAITKLLEIK